MFSGHIPTPSFWEHTVANAPESFKGQHWDESDAEELVHVLSVNQAAPGSGSLDCIHREAPSRTWLWVCGMETNAYQDMSVQGHHNSWEKRKHLVGMSCSKLQHPGTPQHINNGHSSCLNTIKRSSGTKKVRTRISTYFLYSVSIPTGIYPIYSPDFLWLSIETSNLKFPFIPANSPKGTGGQETVGG